MPKDTLSQIARLFLHKSRRGRAPKSWIGVLLLVILAVVLARLAPDNSSSSSSNAPSGSSAKEQKWGEVQVERFVDGDTIVVEGGVKIRLVGADTPETVKPNWPVEPFGPEASAFTKKTIEKAGKRVRLEPDGDRTDRYGRQLALVYVGEILLNEELIRQGLATAELQYRYSKEMKTRFQAAEYEAQKAKRGIWSRER